MGITVSDIEQKEFAFKGAGYDPYDVDSYLDQVCDEMIALQDRIDALEASLKEAKAAAAAATEAVRPIPQEVAKTDGYASIQRTSETLENILLSAQRISDEAVAEANRKANEVIEEAKTKAEDIIRDVRGEKTNLEQQVKDLKAASDSYRERFMNLLNEQKELLELHNSVLDDDDK